MIAQLFDQAEICCPDNKLVVGYIMYIKYNKECGVVPTYILNYKNLRAKFIMMLTNTVNLCSSNITGKCDT